jgi:hypothetical protein
MNEPYEERAARRDHKRPVRHLRPCRASTTSEPEQNGPEEERESARPDESKLREDL